MFCEIFRWHEKDGADRDFGRYYYFGTCTDDDAMRAGMLKAWNSGFLFFKRSFLYNSNIGNSKEGG